MAMQQSGKGAASGSGPNPALSDEQADQFAASFTPTWDDADEAVGDTTDSSVTAVMDALPPAPDAPPIIASPVIFAGGKQTLIGVPPQANAMENVGRPALSSAEAIEPDNVIEVAQIITDPPPVLAPPPPVHVNHNARTQLMDARPAQQPVRRPSSPPPSQIPQARSGAVSARPPARAIAADPFRAPSPSDDLDFVPKKSSKAFLFVIAGLAIVAGLGLFLKFALTDDAPKTAPAQQVSGPAVTTAEIPPPPPKVEAPPTVAAVKTAEPAQVQTTPPAPPAPLAAPVRAEPPPRQTAVAPAALRNEPRQPRQAAPPPPQPAPVAPPAPKTPPKAPNGGIVRDNPF